MKDAIGGTFSLQIVFIFVLLVNGYIAYSVNYTRAFRTKNGIINIIEENEGINGDEVKEKLKTYVRGMGYGASTNQVNSVSSSYDVCYSDLGFCYTCRANSAADAASDEYKGVTYTVTTFVSVDIPVVRNFLPLGEWLAVRGETKSIYAPNGCKG